MRWRVPLRTKSTWRKARTGACRSCSCIRWPARVPAAGSPRLSGSHTKSVSAPLDDLRRFAVARSLFSPTTLERALDTLGFVQADPIRAPARAQDLTLRHRVEGYRAGDLERRYATLGVEEDVFINYGFVTRTVHALMHPRTGARSWPSSTQ